MKGFTLDAGAFIAFERSERIAVMVVARARELKLPLAAPAGVIAQVWRDGSRQARLTRLLGSGTIEVEPLDDRRARAAGQLCGAAGSRDVIDASVVLCARARDHVVVTSDAGDLKRLDPALRCIPI